MEGWRNVLVQGADELGHSAVKVELSEEAPPIKEKGIGSIELTPIIVKKEELLDLPPKVPKFQYVDFPSLYQCIQQLAVPPLDSWLPGTPQGRVPPSQGPTATDERVPRFRYVDYPSLHHCIQQLSVPPLESWSFGLTQPESNRARTGSRLLRSPAVFKVDGAASGNKRDPGNTLCGPGASLSPCTAIAATTLIKLQPSLCTSNVQPVTGQARLEREGSNHLLKRPLDPKSRPTCTAANRNTVSRLNTCKRNPPVHGLYSGMNQMQPKLGNSTNSQQDSRKTLPGLACTFCQEMFSDTKQLMSHQKNHQDENPNGCPT
ncbi:hypothetical protein AAFF_G00324950 [Aldrovandia affinis]|uniref:C2H2-type domain-containing protein n=1 Tax=Aldrovandia affinis TaxID=143900 RepID=A0AAD7T9T3_9TELE|nr:hypothetical protein AAFF_G00324950 [Aldrovandia affinis]